jgi:simple sugar transport system substrate-binding protein
MEMKKLHLLLILVIVLTAAFAAAPVLAEEGDDAGQAPVNIYIVSHGACSWDAFWCVEEKGNKDAAEDLDVDITLITPDKFNPEQTAQDVDKALAANPDVLIVTVTDGVLFEEPLLRAIDSGIPVIAYNAADWRPPDERIPYLTYIGQDEYEGGYQGGKLLVDTYGGTRGVCVNQAVGHEGLDARCRGFADALAEAGIESEVLAVPDDPAESATIQEDYFTANPDADLWMTLGPNAANPFYAFMDSAGLETGDIYHGTFDLSPEIQANIENGTTLFGIDQQPYGQGYLSVWWATMIGRHGLYPPTAITATGPGLITKDKLGVITEQAGTYR